jgi:hypothetical protein
MSSPQEMTAASHRQFVRSPAGTAFEPLGDLLGVLEVVDNGPCDLIEPEGRRARDGSTAR